MRDWINMFGAGESACAQIPAPSARANAALQARRGALAGLACVRRFAQDQARLILLARSEDKLQALAAELATQTEVHALAMDMQDKAAVLSLPEASPAEFQAVDILLDWRWASNRRRKPTWTIGRPWWIPISKV